MVLCAHIQMQPHAVTAICCKILVTTVTWSCRCSWKGVMMSMVEKTKERNCEKKVKSLNLMIDMIHSSAIFYFCTGMKVRL